ncbi:hypothetical protein NESM_000361900 [Novymonas esmeraldas]|uniref:Uncharacterized protein n=1 Tax=Novymonas esmeraldas TaxID=1808958 RepID=A0AAW0EK45_9TRYP
MSVDALPPLLACATRATAKNAEPPAIEAALQELQQGLLGVEGPDTASTEALLERVCAARTLLARDTETSQNTLNTERLLLEAVVSLSELLLGAAAGQRVRTKVARRMEDVLLPILFLRTGLSPAQLRSHAVALAWSAFDRAENANGESVAKLRRLLASWRSTHGWDFACGDGAEASMQLTCAAAAAASRGVTESSSAQPDKSPASGAAPVQSAPPRVVLRDVSWNAVARRSATGGIPAYLLTKRRRCDSAHPRDAHTSAHTSVAEWSRPPAAALPPAHTPTVHPTTPCNIALDSPVKRRRRDITVDVPPSPDRPG